LEPHFIAAKSLFRERISINELLQVLSSISEITEQSNELSKFTFIFYNSLVQKIENRERPFEN
jgi:flagellar biosynthesis component FlhA